ncbi:MAG: amino acid ABC transporter permease [Proteobacteria bacterium]|jgi:general L-amino acid transport system permease protein|nr:amino acid ABC transporter permease [Pseudomonadota bacterium]
MAIGSETGGAAPRPSIWNDPKTRAILYQAIVVVIIALIAAYFIHNTAENLERRGIASGFSFLSAPAGFDVGMSPFLKYDAATATHGTVLIVGILNTLLVAMTGIFLATIIGFIIGILRLSPNWLVSRLAYCYVETLRNIPLLLQLLFWYVAVLGTLPSKRDSISLFDTFFLNIEGLFGPLPVPQPGFWTIPAAIALAVAIIVVVKRWARRRQDETGQQFPVFLMSAGLLIALPLAAASFAGFPIEFEHPQQNRFGLRGGMVILPEFAALVLGLSLYTGAFIAEIVRSGIQAISHGQSEAAHALGLRPGPTLRLVIIPQALRVIIPPLTSQYLNLTKNSSLAVAIGGAEIVAVFAGTSLNQAGQAIEIIAITMGFYLTVSLLISMFMNWYNRRIALVER